MSTRVLSIVLLGLLLAVAGGLSLDNSLLRRTSNPMETQQADEKPAAPEAQPSDFHVLTSATAEEWIAALRSQRKTGADSEAAFAHLLFLARINPGLALEVAQHLASNEAERQLWLTRLLQAWADTDPQEAWKWATQARPASPFGGEASLTKAVLSRLAQTSPTTAVGLVEDRLSSPQDSTTESSRSCLLAGEVIHSLIEAGQADLARQTVERWTHSAAAETVDNGAYSAVAFALGAHSPGEAATWLSGLPSSANRNQAIAAHAAHWSATSPRDAMAWATSLPDPEARTGAMTRVLNRWAERDRVSAAQWLSENDASPAADHLIACFVSDSSFGDQHPQRALAWAELIHDRATRLDVTSHLLATWARTDSLQAERYLLEAAGLSEDDRHRLRSAILLSTRNRN